MKRGMQICGVREWAGVSIDCLSIFTYFYYFGRLTDRRIESDRNGPLSRTTKSSYISPLHDLGGVCFSIAEL